MTAHALSGVTFLDGLPRPRIVMNADYPRIAANAAYRRGSAVEKVTGANLLWVFSSFFSALRSSWWILPAQRSLDTGSVQRVPSHHTPRGEHVDVEIAPICDAEGKLSILSDYAARFGGRPVSTSG